MRSFLVRCYPARWRDRYGDEFMAILEARPLGPYDVADILLGALDARLRLRGRAAAVHGKGFPMSLRIGGIAAITGAGLLAGAGLLRLLNVKVDDTVPAAMFFSGLAVLLVALAGLSAFQARTHPRLTWGAFAVTAVGTAVGVVGYFAILAGWGESYWNVWALGFLSAIIGSALFAVATYQTATLSRAGAVLLAVGSLLPLLTLGSNNQQVLMAAIGCFLLGWFVLGVQAIRLDRPAGAPSPA